MMKRLPNAILTRIWSHVEGGISATICCAAKIQQKQQISHSGIVHNFLIFPQITENSGTFETPFVHLYLAKYIWIRKPVILGKF